MKIDEIKLLCDYNDWADARILTACAKVSPQQYGNDQAVCELNYDCTQAKWHEYIVECSLGNAQ